MCIRRPAQIECSLFIYLLCQNGNCLYRIIACSSLVVSRTWNVPPRGDAHNPDRDNSGKKNSANKARVLRWCCNTMCWLNNPYSPWSVFLYPSLGKRKQLPTVLLMEQRVAQQTSSYVGEPTFGIRAAEAEALLLHGFLIRLIIDPGPLSQRESLGGT